MLLIDISWPLNLGMTHYKDREDLNYVPLKSYDKDAVNETRIEINAHTGTHVDAPWHFSDQVGGRIESVPLTQLIGTCAVFDMTHVVDAITARDLENLPLEENLIVLFKTQNSFKAIDAPFDPHFIYIDASAARVLADYKIKAIGFDYLGIERNQPDHTTHKTLLSAGVAVIEGLRLAHVEPNAYTLLCFPLAVQGIDAAPARALLATE